MNIFEAIVAKYPELEKSIIEMEGVIVLQNDGEGDYIKEWNYSKPIPNNMELLKIWKEI